MFCTNCGNELQSQDRFCPKCGKSHESLVEPSVPTHLDNSTTESLEAGTKTLQKGSVSQESPYKIVTLPSGKRVKVKKEAFKSSTSQQSKERLPLTDKWAWLLAIVPIIVWSVVAIISPSWGAALICSGIVLIILTLKDEAVLEKAGYRKEAAEIGFHSCLFPYWYLFRRAKLTNKNYGPAVTSFLLWVISIALWGIIIQAVVTDAVDVASGQMSYEEFNAKWRD